MRDFKKLQVWEKAHKLALEIYRISSSFPNEELFSLTSQLRRSAVSVPSNIAEGCGRGGSKELARFCAIAAGSASELEYQLLLAYDLGYICDSTYSTSNKSVIEIKKMLNAFIKRLSSDS